MQPNLPQPQGPQAPAMPQPQQPAPMSPMQQGYQSQFGMGQPGGMNITGGQAPGVTSVGGLMQMKSLRQVEMERQQAIQNNAAPEMTNLAGHIKKCWMQARTSKETTVEPRMLQSVRQRRGEYDPSELAMLKEQGRSTIYMYLTSNKCRAALGWLKDTLVVSSNEKPWELDPEPVADVPPDMLNEIMQLATQQIAQMQQQAQAAGQPPPDDQSIREMMLALKDQALAHIQQLAKESAERMERKMDTQMKEGGWTEAFSMFLDDLTTFPAAIIKGPVVRKKPKLAWIQGPNKQFIPDVQDTLVLEFERVDPFMLYPAPDANGINDGYLIQRHRLERRDLYELKGVEGYSDAAIDLVLYEYGRGGMHDWIAVDTAKATAEGKSTMGMAQNPSELIDALQFWGPVQGRLLIEWGMDESSIDDPMKDYNIEGWLIGNIIIKASINPDPLGRKPYYKASWEEIPGAFWGNSVADLCRDTQKICNAAARAIVDNMGIASGPQVVVNVDRMPVGENITHLYPWKIHQVTHDPSSSNRPPVEFFQPSSMVQDLMMIYEKFATLADEYTGIPRYMTGDAQVGGAARTASGMSMLMGNAGKSIKQVVSNIDVGVLTQAVGRLYYYNMRYSKDPDLKMAGVNIQARGAEALLMREAAQQRRNEFLQIALSNPTVNQVVGNEGIAALLREGAKDLNMDTDAIVAPMPILRKKWADAQQQAAQQAEAQKQFELQLAAVSGHTPPASIPKMPPSGVAAAPPLPPKGPPQPRVMPHQAGMQPPGQGHAPPPAPDRRALMNGSPVVHAMNPKR